MEPTTVGSLWLENDLHENELEFESHMGRSKKFVHVISDEIRGNPRDLNICIAPTAFAALSRGRKSMPPIWVEKRVHETRCVTAWIYVKAQWHEWVETVYDFTLISCRSTFSDSVNLCNINCVIFSDTHSLWHSSVKSRSWCVKICRNPWLYLSLPCNNFSKGMHKSSM